MVFSAGDHDTICKNADNSPILYAVQQPVCSSFGFKFVVFRVQHLGEIRPFFIYSRIHESKKDFLDPSSIDWILLGLLNVSRLDFIVFVLFLEAVSVREHCCIALWHSKMVWKLCVPHARRVFVQAGWWRWDWPKAGKDTLLVALHSADGQPRKLQQASLLLGTKYHLYLALPPSDIVRYTLAGWARNVPR